MEQPDKVTDLFLAVLDFWELKGGEQINPELADVIELHLKLAYTSGAEMVIDKMKELIVNSNSNGLISVTYLKLILDTL